MNILIQFLFQNSWVQKKNILMNSWFSYSLINMKLNILIKFDVDSIQGSGKRGNVGGEEVMEKSYGREKFLLEEDELSKKHKHFSIRIYTCKLRMVILYQSNESIFYEKYISENWRSTTSSSPDNPFHNGFSAHSSMWGASCLITTWGYGESHF